MPEIEKNFNKLMLKIGFTMLIFLGGFSLLSEVRLIVNAILLEMLSESIMTATVISELFSGFVYAMSFTIPAVLLAVMTKNDKQPLIKSAALPKETLLYICAGVATILSFAYINGMIVNVFEVNNVVVDDSWKTGYDQPYEFALHIVTTAVAPGIFEELMFRGVMLAKLRPYGKTTSILISALMFALMHQNSKQFLYTFAAGIVLGWIATETGSLLLCMLVHFSNNAFSVIEDTALANMPSDVFNAVFYLIELVIFVLGVISFVFLVRSYEKRKRARENDFSAGMFGKELCLKSENADFAISPAKTIKLFFAPTIIIFICISIVQVVTLLLADTIGLSWL